MIPWSLLVEKYKLYKSLGYLDNIPPIDLSDYRTQKYNVDIQTSEGDYTIQLSRYDTNRLDMHICKISHVIV